MEKGPIGTHCFDGACDPQNRITGGSNTTFSFGIFEWVPSKNKTPKRGKVKVRVSGSIHQRDLVEAKAQEICSLLDKGEYTGRANVTVK